MVHIDSDSTRYCTVRIRDKEVRIEFRQYGNAYGQIAMDLRPKDARSLATAITECMDNAEEPELVGPAPF